MALQQSHHSPRLFHFLHRKKYVALFENKLEISEYFMFLYVALMCVVIHHEVQYCLCVIF